MSEETRAYGKSRQRLAEALRELQDGAAPAASPVDAALHDLAGVAATQFEQPSVFGIQTFDRVLPEPYDGPWLTPFRRELSPGCYEASWGWVHVRPGCRCPR